MPLLALIAALLLVGSAAAETLEPSPVLAQRFPEEGRIEDGSISDVSLGAGVRGYTDSGWHGLDTLFALAIDWDTRPVHWPVGVAAGLHGAWGSVDDINGNDFDVRSVELSVGARRDHRFGPLGVDYSLGALVGNTRLDSGPFSDDDFVIGGYAEAGLVWIFHSGLTLGISGRGILSETLDIDLASESASLTGWEALATVGYRF